MSISHRLSTFKTHCFRTHVRHRGVFAVKGVLFSSVQHEGSECRLSAATVHEPAPLITPFSLVFSIPQTAKSCKQKTVARYRQYVITLFILPQIHIFGNCFFCARYCKRCFSQNHFRLRNSRACGTTLERTRLASEKLSPPASQGHSFASRRCPFLANVCDTTAAGFRACWVSVYRYSAHATVFR